MIEAAEEAGKAAAFLGEANEEEEAGYDSEEEDWILAELAQVKPYEDQLGTYLVSVAQASPPKARTWAQRWQRS